jgi:hypothetical protein
VCHCSLCCAKAKVSERSAIVNSVINSVSPPLCGGDPGQRPGLTEAQEAYIEAQSTITDSSHRPGGSEHCFHKIIRWSIHVFLMTRRGNTDSFRRHGWEWLALRESGGAMMPP